MTQMLQALKHRGPDSTGFALYGKGDEGVHVLRFKVAEQEEMKTGFDIHRLVIERKAAVDTRLAEMGAEVIEREDATEYAFRYHFKFDGDLKRLIDFIEDLDGVEILSVGKALELIKDLGDATVVSDQYGLKGFLLAPTRLAIRVWRPSRTSIFVPRIPTGLTRSMMYR
jgi:glutamate synthase domain-containing protein 1